MKKEEWNEGLNHLDSDLVEEYVRKKEQLTQENKMPKGFWLRVGAVAACLVLMIGVMAALQEYKPPVPVWENAIFSAEEIGEMFGNQRYDGGTNAYTKIYVPDAKYLYIDPIPEDEYLSIYQYTSAGEPLNKNTFSTFIEDILPEVAKSLGAAAPSYEIEEEEDRLSADVDISDCWVSLSQNKKLNSLFLANGSEKLRLNGQAVQVDQRLSDEEILKALEPIKNELFYILGVSFPDAKVARSYQDVSADDVSITVYFYDESAHPLNAYLVRPVSDKITIELYHEKENGVAVDGNFLTKCYIHYQQWRNDVETEYNRIAQAKKISLAEAEALLYNGYVFGGHACPLCMSMQEKVDFTGYAFVNMEYMSGYDKQTGKFTVAIPFYAFYKKIGTAQNGNLIYAKTYVAAIEVSDYESYFESQKDKHWNIGYAKAGANAPAFSECQKSRQPPKC